MTGSPHALKFDAKLYAFRKNRDGIVVSFVVDPHADCIAALGILGIGEECVIELSGPNAAPTKSSRTVTSTKEIYMEGPNVPGRVLTEAERAIKMAHVYASNPEWGTSLGEIHMVCGVESCAEFKTNSKALFLFLEFEKGLKATL